MSRVIRATTCMVWGSHISHCQHPPSSACMLSHLHPALARASWVCRREPPKGQAPMLLCCLRLPWLSPQPPFKCYPDTNFLVRGRALREAREDEPRPNEIPVWFPTYTVTEVRQLVCQRPQCMMRSKAAERTSCAAYAADRLSLELRAHQTEEPARQTRPLFLKQQMV